ncbi:MAG: tetratricopeptide repeat protein [Alphaproteobacteria bacterium]|nr:tetratricopeptide repeat protein [Alphaproteobacteria bacterium]
MNDAFEEVEESLRQDRAAELWRTWSPWLIGAAVALILAVAGYQGWRYIRAQGVEKDAKAFSAVMDDIQKKDFAAARSGLAKLSDSKTGFAAMADNVLAAVDEDQSKDPAAVAKDLKNAADKDKGLLGDIAQLKLAYVKADTASLDEVKALVAPLQKTGGPLGALGRELVAAKEAATGDAEAARRDYQALTLDLDAPQAMQQRVRQALALLPPEPAKPEAAKPADAAATSATDASPAAPAAASDKSPK